jgi:hypothetical protein
MLEFEDDTVGGGFNLTPTTALFRAELDDPQLTNAQEHPVVFEIMQTFNFWSGIDQMNPSFRLAESIISHKTLPNEVLNESTITLYERLLKKKEEDEIKVPDKKIFSNVKEAEA